MFIAPIRGVYQELICLKTQSIIHIDWGNIEVFEGKPYRECIGGAGFLKENLKVKVKDCVLIEINGCLWPFDKKYFGTKSELRDKKLKELGL